jgi:hypothetical protein
VERSPGLPKRFAYSADASEASSSKKKPSNRFSLRFSLAHFRSLFFWLLREGSEKRYWDCLALPCSDREIEA